MATYNGYTTDQLRAFVDQYFSNPNSADIQYLLNQGLISNTNPDTLLYFGLTNMLGFSPDTARSAVSDVFSASSTPEPGTSEPPSEPPPPVYEPPPYEPPPVVNPPVYEPPVVTQPPPTTTPTVQEVINTITQPVNTPVTTPTLESWQKLDASGNIVSKTMADYTLAEMVPYAQNIIAQQQAAGTYVTPSQFQTFAAQQGVPSNLIPALVASLTFPTAPVTTPPVTTPPVTTPTTPTTTGPKPLSAYTSAEMIPYIQNLFRDNPSATAQMVRQYAMSQNVPASVIDAALGGVQVPTANFSQFTVGGGNTSLATPTNDFFYGAGPTQQAPYMFKSGAAGYTRLLPQSLEFGVPVATGTKPLFQPGIFDKAALQKAYEAQTGQSYGGEVVPANDITQASYMGGKITPDKIAYEKGGKVKGLLGPKPDSPDDGYASLQVGEYVIRKKAVNKYGEDFLEALNESRIPKKKAKGLL